MRSLRYILITTTALLFSLVYQPSYAQKKKSKSDEKEITKYEKANAEYLFIDAQKFFLLEDYERALTFLNQSLEIDKANHAAYFKIGEIHLLTGKNKEGLEAIRKAINLRKDNKYYYILAAQLYKASDDLASAAEQYELMVANTTDYKEFLLDMSDVYAELGNYQEAIKVLNKTEQEFGTPDKFRVRKTELMLKAGQVEQAINYLKTALEKRPYDFDLIQEYAGLLISQERTQEAIDFMENHTGYPDFIKPNLVKLYIFAGLDEKAAALAKEVFDAGDLTTRSRVSILSDILSRPVANTQELAEAELKKLQKELPDDPYVLNLQSKVLEQRQVNSQTSFSVENLKVLTKLVETDPATLKNWQNLLNYQYEAENWADLLDYSEQSLDYFPNQGLFYFYYASAALYTQDIDEASDLLKQALRLSSKNDSLKARIYGKQSEIAFVNQETDQAKALFSQATALVNHPEIVNNYSFRLALQKVELPEVLERIKKLVKEYPDRLKYIRTQAFAYFQSANYTQAKQLLEQGLEKFPQQINGQTRELYGDILIKLDMVNEALEAWQKAKTLGNTSEKIDQKIANKEYFE